MPCAVAFPMSEVVSAMGSKIDKVISSKITFIELEAEKVDITENIVFFGPLIGATSDKSLFNPIPGAGGSLNIPYRRGDAILYHPAFLENN